MSGIAHPHSPVRLRSSRLTMLIVAMLVVGAAIVGVIALTSSGSDRSSSSGTPVTRTGGPNESVRGQSAASAVGASEPTETGGPNEAARGNAASSATRP